MVANTFACFNYLARCRPSYHFYLLALATMAMVAYTSYYRYDNNYDEFFIFKILPTGYKMKNWTFHEVFSGEIFRATMKASTQYSPLTGLDNDNDKDKYFIYRCDRQTMGLCGGWGDRIKGIITSYLIANITGRTFKSEILFNSCDMNTFLVPNQVNWSLPKSFHETVKESQNVLKFSHLDDESFCLKAINDSLPNLEPKYIYFKTNVDCTIFYRDSHRYQRHLSWMNNLTWSEIEGNLLKRLFKPSPYLQGKVQTFIKDNVLPHERLMCVHIRIGRNPTIPDDVDPRLRAYQLPLIWDFLNKTTRLVPSKIFMMTDSNIVVSLAKKLSFAHKFIFSPGQIVHIDRNKGVSDAKRCTGFEKLLLEQYILLQCDSVLLSQSGLSLIFASLRETDESLFCPLKNSSIVACSREQARDFYRRFDLL